ncbi:MAG: hypothetical protein M5U14_10925 [Acidimicrobiia bacterium]|nr:hypothetical protein [Acidimicrobiia bacterium]
MRNSDAATSRIAVTKKAPRIQLEKERMPLRTFSAVSTSSTPGRVSNRSTSVSVSPASVGGDPEGGREDRRVDAVHQVRLVGEEPLELLVGVFLGEVPEALDVGGVAELLAERLDLLLGRVDVEEDLEPHALLPLLGAVVDEAPDEEGRPEHRERDRDRDDPGEGHEEVAAQRHQGLPGEVADPLEHGGP